MLTVQKEVLANITKCYALCPITLKGVPGFLLGTEKEGGCYFYDLQGKLVEPIWTDFGGLMSIVPYPGAENAFLATQEFYSPNNSAESRIVLAYWDGASWQVHTLVQLPFVHRFDAFQVEGVNHLIACTIKDAHEFKDDWNHPGKIYVGELPQDPRDALHGVNLRVLLDGLVKNHGYARHSVDGVPHPLVTSESGVLQLTPPMGGEDWKTTALSDIPTSDAALLDMDGDGKEELFTYGPFHGDSFSIFRQDLKGNWARVFIRDTDLPFLHAIWVGEILGTPTLLVGHRRGQNALYAVTYDETDSEYKFEKLDEGAGPSNVTYLPETQTIVAANRETDELAFYHIS